MFRPARRITPGRRRCRSTCRWSPDRPPAQSAICATSPACSKGCGRSAPAGCSTTCWRSCWTPRSTSAAPSAGSSCSPARRRPGVQAGPRPRPAAPGGQHLPDQPQDSRRGLRDRAAALVADLLDGELANVHMGTVALGIRNVLCVPLEVVRYVETHGDGPTTSAASASSISTARARRAALGRPGAPSRRSPPRRRSQSRTRGSIVGRSRRRKLEQDIRIAAEIQQALLPKPRHGGAFFETAARTIPCRSIGGDFYDVLDLPTTCSASRWATWRGRARRRPS